MAWQFRITKVERVLTGRPEGDDTSPQYPTGEVLVTAEYFDDADSTKVLHRMSWQRAAQGLTRPAIRDLVVTEGQRMRATLAAIEAAKQAEGSTGAVT